METSIPHLFNILKLLIKKLTYKLVIISYCTLLDNLIKLIEPVYNVFQISTHHRNRNTQIMLFPTTFLDGIPSVLYGIKKNT